MEEEELLTVLEAAERYEMTASALRTAIFRGSLPYVEKYGKKLLKPADVKAYKETAKKGRPKKDGEEGDQTAQ